MLTLLIEDNFEGTRVIIDFENSSHGLFIFVDHATSNDNLNKVVKASNQMATLGLVDEIDTDKNPLEL